MTTTTIETNHFEHVIKEEQMEFKSDEESNNILCGSQEEKMYDGKSKNVEDNFNLRYDLIMKEELITTHLPSEVIFSDDTNTSTYIKEEESCHESTAYKTYEMDVFERTEFNEEKGEPYVQIVKGEFQSDKEQKIYECIGNEIVNIKLENNDGLNSELNGNDGLIIEYNTLNEYDESVKSEEETEFLNNSVYSPLEECSTDMETKENLTKDESEPRSSFTSETDERKAISSDTDDYINNSDEESKMVGINPFDKKYITKKQKIFESEKKTDFKCNKCEKSFNRKKNLNRHIFLHTGKKPFKCHKCKKSFMDKFTLNRHAMIHTEDKPFKCDNCEKRFTQKGQLKRHVLNHMEEKPFKCHTCIKSFVDKFTLRRHIITHTDEKPFKCNNCDKSFNQQRNLKRHVMGHTGEKPFKCNICEKGFTDQATLRRHALIHSDERPFKCNICEKTFNQRGHFESHALIHAEDRPFKCNKCEKSYTERRYLTRHAKIHR